MLPWPRESICSVGINAKLRYHGTNRERVLDVIALSSPLLPRPPTAVDITPKLSGGELPTKRISSLCGTTVSAKNNCKATGHQS